MAQNDEIKQLLSIGKPQVFTLDPKHQVNLIKKAIDGAVYAAKQHLGQKRMVHIIVVKE